MEISIFSEILSLSRASWRTVCLPRTLDSQRLLRMLKVPRSAPQARYQRAGAQDMILPARCMLIPCLALDTVHAPLAVFRCNTYTTPLPLRSLPQVGHHSIWQARASAWILRVQDLHTMLPPLNPVEDSLFKDLATTLQRICRPLAQHQLLRAPALFPAAPVVRVT